MSCVCVLSPLVSSYDICPRILRKYPDLDLGGGGDIIHLILFVVIIIMIESESDRDKYVYQKHICYNTVL